MYCKNCGKDGHGAGECGGNAAVGMYPPFKPKVTKPVTKVTKDGTVTKAVTPGEPCPTCGHRVAMTAAQRKKASRAKKGES